MRESQVERVARHPGVRATIVEKPFALTLDEVDRMVAVCHERDIILAVFHQLRFWREFGRLRQVIADGQLGSLQSVHAFCYGNLFDQGTHMADMLSWILAEQQAQWVTAQGWKKLTSLERFAEIPRNFRRAQHAPRLALDTRGHRF